MSLKGPPRPSSPSPTRQNIKEASPESAAEKDAEKDAEKEKEIAPAADADAEAEADAEGRTNRPRRAAANREQQMGTTHRELPRELLLRE